MKTTAVMACAALVAAAKMLSPEHDAQQTADTYLGQTPPGLTPVLFDPRGVFSPDAWDCVVTVSSDGREMYFTRGSRARQGIMVTRLENDGWTEPVEMGFSRGSVNFESHLAPDGRTLYFLSERRQASGESGTGVWFVERDAEGTWGEPRYFGPGMFVSVARSGNLYMTDVGRRAGGGIVVFPWTGEGYGPPRRLEGGPNAVCCAGHAFVAPDESYILFDGSRPGGHGENDLWVSFRNADGSWDDAVNLGETVNTEWDDWVPTISPDGRYIFYTSTNNDIYWVSARILDRLREEAPSPLDTRISSSLR